MRVPRRLMSLHLRPTTTVTMRHQQRRRSIAIRFLSPEHVWVGATFAIAAYIAVHPVAARLGRLERIGLALVLTGTAVQWVWQARRSRAFASAVRAAAAGGRHVEAAGGRLAVVAESVNDLVDEMTERRLEAERERDMVEEIGRAHV